MNWGHKIIIVFTLFAAGILTLVIGSMRKKIDMVTADYYAEELKYQQVIDGRQNANRLSAPVVVTQPGEQVEISFPEELHQRPLQGYVLFYRPSDAGKDIRVPLQPDAQGRQQIDRRRLQPGNYQVKLQWETDGKPYFQETQLFIQP